MLSLKYKKFTEMVILRTVWRLGKGGKNTKSLVGMGVGKPV